MQDNKNKDIVLKQDYDEHSTIIKRNGEIYLNIRQRVPINFETLLDYIENNPSKFVTILDGITIALKVSKRKSLLFHKTLFDKVVDISVISGSYRIENFITLPINIVYSIICQYR